MAFLLTIMRVSPSLYFDSQALINMYSCDFIVYHVYENGRARMIYETTTSLFTVTDGAYGYHYSCIFRAFLHIDHVQVFAMYGHVYSVFPTLRTINSSNMFS